jgi:hypothetical protein
VHAGFRAPRIASVDTVANGGHRWRLIVALRRASTVKLAALYRDHRRGTEVVIGIGDQVLVHTRLATRIAGGVWQISGLRFGSAQRDARLLRAIAAGYPKPKPHHHRRHHRRRHRHRHHRVRHRKTHHHHHHHHH